jgi:hypothetical protein
MRDSVGMAFLIAGFAPMLIGALHSASRRYSAALAWNSAGTGLHLIGVVIRDELFYAVMDAGVFAWCLWHWWNNGGGDGTRRRLRHWARKFQGTRRTAPAGGTA